MTGLHEPTPEFRSFLEAEITRALRREARFDRTVRGAPRRRLRSAAIVVATLALGAAAGAAPAQIQDARQRERLLSAAQAEERLAVLRLEIARAAYDDARRGFEVGLVGRASLAAADAERQAAEASVLRIRLDQEEIRATAAPPRDDIAAPMVGSRDFVSERLRLELPAAQQRLTSAEQEAAEVERRYRVGAVHRLALLDAQAEVARAKRELQRLAGKLDLREAFLQQGLSVAEVENRLARLELLNDAELARQLHAVAEERLEDLRQRHAVGLVDRIEVMRAEVDVLERAAELQAISRRLEAIDEAARGARG